MLKLDRNYSDYTDETDEDYPEGKAIDASSSESFDGTPLLASFMNDINGAHIAMYEKAFGSTDEVSGEADTQKSSQFVDAIEKYVGDKIDLKDKTNLKFTYIVNSDESLAYWLSNKASGESSGGDDFTSVLIKAGEWSYDGSVVELDTIGTKAIEGEVGNKVNLTQALKYYVLSNYKTPDHYIKGLNLFCVRNGTGAPLYPICYCANLTDVTITFDGTLANAYGIDECENLINCNVVVGKTGSVSNACCYYNCKNLTNCDGTAYGVNATVYKSCYNLVNCSVGYSYAGSSIKYFELCKNITNIDIRFRTVSVGTPVTFFESCTELSNCKIDFMLQQNAPFILNKMMGFYKCQRLNNCYVSISLNSYSLSGGARSVGLCYNDCEYLVSCYGFIKSYVAGADMLNVYTKCKGMLNCYASRDVGDQTSGINDICVYNCEGVRGCKTVMIKSGATSLGGSYELSYSVYNFGTGADDTYKCARTANGGFNS